MSVAISVIIPYFNSSRTILETVKSLEKQSFKAFEVIIVDDGSTMEEAAQLSLLESNKLNYLMLKQENKGAAEARNYGAQCAKGSYLIFLDSDDIIAPTYLEKCFNILEGNKNIKLVYSLARRFDASDEPWQLGDFHEFKDILPIFRPKPLPLGSGCRAVLLLDVLFQDAEWCTSHTSSKVGRRPQRT